MLTFLVLGAFILCTTHASTSCNVANQCVGQFITDDEIYFWGYYSGAQSTASTTSNRIYCYGSFSCFNSVLTSADDIWVMGTAAAANASLIAGDSIHCEAANSCSYSTISTKDILFCEGEESCSFSTIRGTCNIYGYGGYSLKNSTINSINMNGTIMTVEIRGYESGYGTKIQCEPGHICNIQCWGTACDYTVCNGSGCSISYQYSKITADPLIRSLWQIITNNDMQCNQHQQGDRVYDDYLEHKDGADIVLNNNDAIICCRGTGSCQGVNETRATKIVCSGRVSCYLSGSIVADHVSCEGEESCYQSTMEAKNVDCVGTRSCYQSIIISKGGNIFCNGYQSCHSATINTSGNGNTTNVYFLSPRRDTTINCMQNDICNIYYMTPDPDNEQHGNVTCNGECHIQCEQDYYCPNIESATPTINPTIYPSNQPSSIPTLHPTTAQPTANTITPTTGQPSTFKPTTFNPTTGPPATSTVNPITTPSTTPDPATETTPTYTQQNGGENNEKKSDDDAVVIIVIIGCIVVCCVLALFIWISRQKRKTDVLEENEIQIAANRHSSVNRIEPGSFDDINHEYPSPKLADVDDDDDAKIDAPIDTEDVDGPNTMLATTEFIVDGDSENENNDNMTHGRITSDEGEVNMATNANIVNYVINEESAKEVAAWLDSIGFNMYSDMFINHGFDSMDIIKEINDKSDLNEIGVTMLAHQIKILNHIEKLKEH